MAQPESIDDVMAKKCKKSLLAFMKLVDPKCTFGFDEPLIEAWNKLSLIDQRKLYLYLLYRKWRGIDIYEEPYYIIKNCHPVPFNWNGHPGVSELIKTNRAVIAKYQGSFGTYTWDEARVYQMTDIQSFKNQ